MARIGIYVGMQEDPVDNITSVLIGWGRYFRDSDHTFEIFGSAKPPASVADYFGHVATTERTSRTPFDKLVAVYRDTVEYICERSPDALVQFWKYSTNGPGVCLAGWRNDIPVISRFPGDMFNEYYGNTGLRLGGSYLLVNGIGRIPLHLADQVIVLGPYGQSEVVSRGMSPERTHILPPPAHVGDEFNTDYKQQTFREHLCLDDDRLVALYVGRLTKQKGMEFFMEVIERTVHKQEVQFILCGEGPYRKTLDERFPDHMVRTEGYVNRGDIHAYYKAADVYVHPSPFEGVPLVILEALNCGLPVVAREAGDIGFVTENLVTTPGAMSRKLADRDWTSTWTNREYFEDKYQRETLEAIVTNSLSK